MTNGLRADHDFRLIYYEKCEKSDVPAFLDGLRNIGTVSRAFQEKVEGKTMSEYVVEFSSVRDGFYSEIEKASNGNGKTQNSWGFTIAGETLPNTVAAMLITANDENDFDCIVYYKLEDGRRYNTWTTIKFDKNFNIVEMDEGVL